MLMLALSTSGPAASAAVIRDGAVASCKTGFEKLTHSETIMPLAEAALNELGLSPADMDAFAVDVGPGSFTGVRIGVCAINAMAAAFRKPVVPVSSLEALLYGKQNACALLDARNGNGYAMLRADELSLAEAAVVISDLVKALPESTLIIGDGAVLHRETILALLPSARFESGANDVSAAFVALCAWQKLAAGDTVTEAMPMYLRPSQAERLAKEKSK